MAALLALVEKRARVVYSDRAWQMLFSIFDDIVEMRRDQVAVQR